MVLIGVFSFRNWTWKMIVSVLQQYFHSKYAKRIGRKNFTRMFSQSGQSSFEWNTGSILWYSFIEDCTIYCNSSIIIKVFHFLITFFSCKINNSLLITVKYTQKQISKFLGPVQFCLTCSLCPIIFFQWSSM